MPDENKGKRKLSKNMRRLNLVYKIVMATLGGVNIVFSAFPEIPTIYFKVVSVLGLMFPIMWSNILDGCKEYEEQATPQSSEATSPSSESPPISSPSSELDVSLHSEV